MTITVDPGKSGGMAWSMNGLAECKPMPETDTAVTETLLVLTAMAGQEKVAYVEKVGGFIKPRTDGKAGQPGSAMFRFGHGRGVIVGALMAFGWRIIEPTPHQWQRRLGLGTRSACGSDAEWKNKLKAEAQRRFPECRVTLKTADALLMLDFATANEGGANDDQCWFSSAVRHADHKTAVTHWRETTQTAKANATRKGEHQ
jgi:hypothetical protein